MSKEGGILIRASRSWTNCVHTVISSGWGRRVHVIGRPTTAMPKNTHGLWSTSLHIYLSITPRQGNSLQNKQTRKKRWLTRNKAWCSEASCAWVCWCVSEIACSDWRVCCTRCHDRRTMRWRWCNYTWQEFVSKLPGSDSAHGMQLTMQWHMNMLCKYFDKCVISRSVSYVAV